jgi:MFS family permease
MTVAGVAHTVIQPVRQAMVANTVPRHALASALSLNGMVYPSTRIIAPAIGAILVASLGFKWNFFIEAVLYVGIVLLLIPVKLPYRTEGSRQHSSMFASLKSGLSYVKNEKRILQLIVMSLVPNLLFQPVIFFLPVFTVDVLGRDIGAGGALAAAVGLGGVAAAVFIAGIGYLIRKGLAVFLGLIGGCAFILLFSQSHWLWVSFAMLTGLGFSQYVFRVANSTLIQTVVPDAFRSRVMSIYMLDHGITPMSTLLIGLFIDLWDPSWAFTVIASVALSLATVQAILFRSTRQLE